MLKIFFMDFHFKYSKIIIKFSLMIMIFFREKLIIISILLLYKWKLQKNLFKNTIIYLFKKIINFEKIPSWET